MKIYTTATSERGKPVSKSGNKYIEVGFNVATQTPNFRARVMFDEKLSIYYVSFECLSFGSWILVYDTKVFVNSY